jgi:hypothetical protein
MALAHSPRIVTDGLVLCLDAGNTKSYPGSGTTWTDLSGNGNNGTLTNGPTYSSSNGGSIVFDESNHYVSTNYTATFQDFTLCGFVKANNPNGKTWEDIIDSYDLDSSDWCRITLYQGKPSLEIDANSARSSVTSSTIATADQWYHIVGVRSGTTGYLYINGILNKQNSVTGNVISADTDSQFFIGNISRPTSLTEGWNGNIAQASIYNKALTASEIQQNFNALRGRFGI